LPINGKDIAKEGWRWATRIPFVAHLAPGAHCKLSIFFLLPLGVPSEPIARPSLGRVDLNGFPKEVSMLSSKSRFSVVAVIVLAVALHLIAAPSLSAGSLNEAAVRSRGAAAEWLNTVLRWLDRTLVANDSKPAQQSTAGEVGPLTGSCLDPQGNHVWCDH
jgi:hypothetical protein